MNSWHKVACISLIMCMLPVLSEDDFYCPEVNDLTWRDNVITHKCQPPKVYHCARNRNGPNFIQGCAEMKHCISGKEPRLEYNRGVLKVFCEHCYSPRTFNSYPDTPSNRMTKCQEENMECDEEVSIVCPYDRLEDEYAMKRKCRCDARNNYVPYWFPTITDGRSYCSDSKQNCRLANSCDEGYERLIKTYNCVQKCDEGLYRPSDSDECTVDPNYKPKTTNKLTTLLLPSTSKPRVTSTPKVTSTFTPASTSNSNLVTTDTPSTVSTLVLTENHLTDNKSIVIALSVVTGLAIGGLIVCWIKKDVISNWCRRKCRMRADPQSDGRGGRDDSGGRGDNVELQPLDPQSDGPEENGSRNSAPNRSSLHSSLTNSEEGVHVERLADMPNLTEEEKMDVAKTAFRKCLTSFKECMDPKFVLDKLYEMEMIETVSRRDIEELQTSSQKIGQIHDYMLRTMTVIRYDKFKEILRVTGHDNLIGELQSKEQDFKNELQRRRTATSTEKPVIKPADMQYLGPSNGATGISTVDIHYEGPSNGTTEMTTVDTHNETVPQDEIHELDEVRGTRNEEPQEPPGEQDHLLP